MPSSAGQIVVEFVAGNAKFVADTEKAKKAVRDFGSHTVSSMSASSAAIRTLEGNFTHNIRAAERFLATTLKLGPVLQAAFPVVGAIALGGAMSEMATKVYDFFKKMQETPERVAGAFRELQAPIRLFNDELAVTNDRLRNDIAKLEGKPQNRLKEALDDAKVAADQLAESLDKDLNSLGKLLKDEQISAWRNLLGTASTTYIKKEIGGATGQGGLRERVADINEAGRERLNSAKTDAEKNTIQAQTRASVMKEFSSVLSKLDSDIVAAKQAHSAPDAVVRGSVGQGIGYVGTVKLDHSGELEQLKIAKRIVQAEMEKVPALGEKELLTDKKKQLEAANENAALVRPFEDRMEKMRAKLAEVRANLEAAGKSESAKLLAKSWGEALKAITEVNKALAHKNVHLKLSPGQEGQIRETQKQIDLTEAEEQWQTKFAAGNAAVADRILAQKSLTEAIGKGYEALKRANVETQVMQSVGAEKYGDPAWMKSHAGNVSALRGSLGSEYDAHHKEQITATIDKLNDQIELERSLAAAQNAGADALARVALGYRLREMSFQKAGPEALRATTQAFEDERANRAMANLAALNEEITATKKLTAAQLGGEDALRKARLENSIQQMRRSLGGGAEANAVEAAMREKEKLEHQKQTAEEALRSGMAYKVALDNINEQIDSLQKLRAVNHGNLEIEISLRNLEKERIAIMAQQALAMGRARDGVRAFFLDMQNQSHKAADDIYQSLNSAFDKLSENLTQLITGGKTGFAQMFKDIGREMVKFSIKQGLSKASGRLAKALGIGIGHSKANPWWVQIADGKAAAPAQKDPLQALIDKIFHRHKPDGTAADPVHVVGSGSSSATKNPSPWKQIIGTLVGAIGGAGGGGGGSSSSGGGESVTSSITYDGPRASGGPVSPDKAYLVGERGPEILHGMSGNIMSNAASRRMMGGAGTSNYYSIDARGTDPVLVEQRVKMAIAASHQNAVTTTMRASTERMKRTPHG